MFQDLIVNAFAKLPNCSNVLVVVFSPGVLINTKRLERIYPVCKNVRTVIIMEMADTFTYFSKIIN